MQPMSLPWYIVLLISVPQTFLIVKLGFQLFNLRLSFSRALLLSLIGSVLVIFARELPLPFGFHTVILIVSSALLTTVINRTNLWYSFIAIIAGTLILGVLEGVLLPVLLKITSTTTDNLVLRPWLNLLYFLPLGSIAVFFYALAKKRNFVIFDLSLNKD